MVEVVVEAVWMLGLRPVSSSDGAGYPNGDLVGGLRHRAAGGVGTQRGVVVVEENWTKCQSFSHERSSREVDC